MTDNKATIERRRAERARNHLASENASELQA
jgi:hypothetical protein